VDSAIAVDLREHFTVCQAAKPATDWDASGNPGPVQIAEGLARKAPSPISTQPLIFRIPASAVSLRILLHRTRTEMPRFMFHT
jgi:hypothetical protein